MSKVIYEPIPTRKVRKARADAVEVFAVLAYEFYDQIKSGKKRIEYREISDYWSHLLWDDGRAKLVKRIRFNRGYRNPETMTLLVKKIVRDEEEGVFEIHLGKRIK